MTLISWPELFISQPELFASYKGNPVIDTLGDGSRQYPIE
jgi:hypothetical protein